MCALLFDKKISRNKLLISKCESYKPFSKLCNGFQMKAPNLCMVKKTLRGLVT